MRQSRQLEGNCMGKTLANPGVYIVTPNNSWISWSIHMKEGWTHCVYSNPRPPSNKLYVHSHGHCVFWNTFLGKFQLFCSFYKGSRKPCVNVYDENISTTFDFPTAYVCFLSFLLLIFHEFFLFSNLTFGASLTFLCFLLLENYF